MELLEGFCLGIKFALGGYGYNNARKQRVDL